jgi:hypothetical protein
MANLKSNETPTSIAILWPTGMGKNDTHQLYGRLPRKPLFPTHVAQKFARACGFPTPEAWLKWVMAY